ncbi:unnamed protein product [Caenorhabditis auriculariae]|uniref:DUF4773 domain-containing protein n=1 Tax=Caenorhabditis auriculariae TaxID=2777116 RepID=A0A8S1H6X6_9PELO|nr:unnamed protein product [Caenorhabditis auriculariae]
MRRVLLLFNILLIFTVYGGQAETFGHLKFIFRPLILKGANNSIPFTATFAGQEKGVTVIARKFDHERFVGTLFRKLEGNYVLLELPDRFDQRYAVVSFEKSPQALKIETSDYKLKMSSQIKTVAVDEVMLQENGCFCKKKNCACCAGVDLPGFKHSFCVNATYNPVTIGLDLSIGVDGHYFSQEISIRNPPPICFTVPIPGASDIAGLCIGLSELDLDKKEGILSGCIEFEIELIHLRVVRVKLGCFRMPI